MIFTPFEYKKTEGCFSLPSTVSAKAHACLNKEIYKEFWNNFTVGTSSLSLTETDTFIFAIGNAEKLPLDGYEYSINVTKDGITVYAENERNLINGFMTLLDAIKLIDTEDDRVSAAVIPCAESKDKAIIKNRMIHFCVFPETDLVQLRRFVRFCGALKYTHLVLEFWGMLKLDSMKELSWSHGFTKAEIRPIIEEAHDLGIEVIPMFNHWGHASACRIAYGKHVVLDQNPALQTYFTEDGWCWEYVKPKVKRLLRSIRKELIELCGAGEYFHIGCDEAYIFDFTTEEMDSITDFINEVYEELRQENRRAIIWGDMFLYRNPDYNQKNRYSCNSRTPETEKYLIERLNKGILIADWQYSTAEAPIETAKVFTDAGFDCILCPWDRAHTNPTSATDTVKAQNLFGVMHTTWHTLAGNTGIPIIALVAIQCFENYTGKWNPVRCAASAIYRKVLPSYGIYENAGWRHTQIER